MNPRVQNSICVRRYTDLLVDKNVLLYFNLFPGLSEIKMGLRGAGKVIP